MGVGTGVAVGVGSGVSVGSRVGAMVGHGVAVFLGLGVSVGSRVGARVGHGVWVGTGVLEGAGVGVNFGTGVGVVMKGSSSGLALSASPSVRVLISSMVFWFLSEGSLESFCFASWRSTKLLNSFCSARMARVVRSILSSHSALVCIWKVA